MTTRKLARHTLKQKLGKHVKNFVKMQALLVMMRTKKLAIIRLHYVRLMAVVSIHEGAQVLKMMIMYVAVKRKVTITCVQIQMSITFHALCNAYIMNDTKFV